MRKDIKYDFFCLLIFVKGGEEKVNL